jgi:2-polyprenyl-3-methyl-5-hydroxy-6-metoxy-1,4-benzoquinol methylase
MRQESANRFFGESVLWCVSVAPRHLWRHSSGCDAHPPKKWKGPSLSWENCLPFLRRKAYPVTSSSEPSLEDRLIGAAIGALELQSIHVGRRLGLYEALRSPRTAAELADHAGIDVRYAREWLEQQAVAGFVSVDGEIGDDYLDRIRFWLNPKQLAVLVHEEDPAHVSPLADMVAGGGLVIDQVVEAYRTGRGVPYAAYGKSFRDGQAGINRPAFVNDLPTSWMEAVPEVAARLREGGKVADLGSGTGWSTIAMARAFPKATVIGFDSDDASVSDAIANADAAGIPVQFIRADASTMAEHGPFDLVLILEVLHDLARPVEALEAARDSLNEGGVVLVADEKVADGFQPQGDDLERMMYGWSVTYCLPASTAEEPSAALGTVLRPSRLKELAGQAGFSRVDTSDIDAGFFRLYALRP